MSENTITTPEQIDALPAGQWVVAADGSKACLFDTHMGFPQRMWGKKAGGGTKGYVTSYTATNFLPMPLQLAEIEDDFKCPHTRANECGQCTICGSPEVAEARPLEFVSFGEFHAAAEHNSRIAEATP